MGGRCPNSLVVKHVLGKDESQVRFLLRAPRFFRGRGVEVSDNHRAAEPSKSNKCGVAPRRNLRPCGM